MAAGAVTGRSRSNEISLRSWLSRFLLGGGSSSGWPNTKPLAAAAMAVPVPISYRINTRSDKDPRLQKGTALLMLLRLSKPNMSISPNFPPSSIGLCGGCLVGRPHHGWAQMWRVPSGEVNKLTLGTVCMVTGGRATTASAALELNRRAGRAEQSWAAGASSNSMDSRAGAVEEGERVSHPGWSEKVVCFWPYETSLWLERNCETRCRQTQKRKRRPDLICLGRRAHSPGGAREGRYPARAGGRGR